MASIRQSTRLYPASPSMAGTATAGSALPTWVTSAAINQWVPIPNSTINGSPAQVGAATGSNPTQWVIAENGSCLQVQGSRIWYFGGGHHDYAGNEIASIGLNTNSPAWRLERTRTLQSLIWPDGTTTSAYQQDGRPSTRHTYSSPHFIQSLNRYWVFGGGLWSSGGGTTDGTTLVPATYDATVGDWDPYSYWVAPGPNAANSVSAAIAYDPNTETIYCIMGASKELWKLNTSTRAWTKITSNSGKFSATFEVMAWSPRGIFHMTNHGQGTYGNQNSFMCGLYNTTTGAFSDITINASAGLNSFLQIDTNHAGVRYDSSQDCYYFYAGGKTDWAIAGTQTTGTGNGALNSFSMPGVTVGERYTIALTSSTTFTVTGSTTGLDGSGTVGTPYIGKISFTLTQGSTAWVAGAAIKFHVGTGGGGGRIWKVIPNGTSTWDIVELTMTGTCPAVTQAAVAHGNLLTRFQYVPELKGVCALVDYNVPIYFARME